MPRRRAAAVEFADGPRLLADVERVRRLGLHAVGKLERLNAGFQLGVALAQLQVAFVEPPHQVELAALLGRRGAVVANVGDQLLNVSVLRVDVGPLIGPR